MKVIRYGFKLCWQEVPDVMKRYKIGEVGSFNPKNGHGGVCWGLPKECSLTNSQAKTIMWEIWKKRSLTFPQMKVVRKSFAYAYELVGGPVFSNKTKPNFPGVNSIWKHVKEGELPESQTTTIPQFIPTPAELKKAFTKGWSPQHSWCLMKWLQGLIQAYDLFVFGLRSREDVDRVKKSRHHKHKWQQGWTCTSFVGGRAKLCDSKRNTRPWKVYRRCHCPGNQHVSPPSNFYKLIDKDGNPTVPIKWCTCCPLAALELIWQFQSKPGQGGKRCYGKWLTSGRFGTSNTGDVAEMAIDWMVSQEACSEEHRYDTNSGRKSLARWCEALQVPYPESFHIHGDLYDVWSQHYEQDVSRYASFKRRNQSTDPKVASVALKKFANFLGRGKKVKVKLPRRERFLHAVLVRLGHTDEADRIRRGLPSDSEDSEE